MAGETTATVVQPAKPQEVIPRSPSELGVDILAEHEGKTAPHDFGVLFSDETQRPSEAELKGEEEKPSEVKKEEPKGDSKAAPPKPEGDKKEPEKKPEPEKKAKDEVEKKKEGPEKPPEGFVPKEALAESRTKLRVANEKIAALESKLAEKPRQQAVASLDESKWKDFKELSDTEYDALVEDDPIEAQKYVYKLRQYERFQEQKSQATKEAEQSKAKFQSLVDQAVTKIKEAVPGIYDEEGEVSSQLAEFASAHGFDDEAYLDAMTNPATLIVPPGQDKSYLLGPGATSLIKLLHNLRASVATGSDPAKLREEITKELEPKLREAITKELVSKFKDAGTGKFKSLTEVPGSGDQPDKAGATFTEAEWSKLSPEERAKYLGA